MMEARIAILMESALNGTISRDERIELVLLLAERTDNTEVNTLLAKAWQNVNPHEDLLSNQEQQRILQTILAEAPTPYRQRRFMRILTVAASLLIVSLGAVTAFYYAQRPDDTVQELSLAEAVEQSNIKPGNDRAFITLSSGRTILLDDATAGVITEDSGTRIHHLDNGEIRYEEVATDAAPTLNTITIPKGGQYRVVLPDGSRVHLNAETSLTYPTRFSGQQRIVEMTGEALFEVKSLGEPVPFVVKTATQEVTVLGTVFNIEAYDQQVKTSLAEGSVKVTAGTKTVQLRPGQQAISQNNGSPLRVEPVDLDEVLAWHNDLFFFEDEEITSIMDRVARWYNVDIEYRGNLTGKRFGGIFQRSKDLVKLLESLKMTGLVDFKITERRIIVMEK